MRRSRKVPARSAPPGQPLKVLDRLDAALAQRQGGSNAELIRRLREIMFADVDELERSGTVVLPK